MKPILVYFVCCARLTWKNKYVPAISIKTCLTQSKREKVSWSISREIGTKSVKVIGRVRSHRPLVIYPSFYSVISGILHFYPAFLYYCMSVKFSRAHSRVRRLFGDQLIWVIRTNSISIIRMMRLSLLMALMIEMKLISETSAFINLLTRLSARETFLAFCRHENFNTYITVCSYNFYLYSFSFTHIFPAIFIFLFVPFFLTLLPSSIRPLFTSPLFSYFFIIPSFHPFYPSI